jgi:F-type H+-transporting ATPase subunit delta
MIELSPLARPYAKAVFSAALDAGIQTELAEQLELLSAVSQTNEVSSLIEDPELSKEKIARTIINITEGEIGELAKKNA